MPPDTQKSSRSDDGHRSDQDFEQVRHDVGLPSRFRASLTIGARIALWNSFLPRWSARIRTLAPEISLSTEIGFEESLMRRIIAGTMDLALVGGPRQEAGLRVEGVFDETLVLAGGRPAIELADEG